MSEVKSGDNVSIHYTGSLEDGSVFDSSSGRDPLAFTVGSGQIIPGLDKALAGMKVGDKKKVTIPSDEAYGAHNSEGVLEVPRSEMPDDLPLEIGVQLEMRSPDGQAMPVTVTAMTDDTVTLDANHFLAGKVLVFDFELIAIG
ncbi:MAG: peptidylprolyl isomerase [Rhodobacteraceae bacterium]|nr:peptidylprolyl isomerase [Paracoccaceae bacterium]